MLDDGASWLLAVEAEERRQSVTAFGSHELVRNLGKHQPELCGQWLSKRKQTG